ISTFRHTPVTFSSSNQLRRNEDEMKRLKRLWVALGLLSVAGIGAQAYRVSRSDSGPIVRTTQVSRGDIVDAIATTGTLQAVTTVQVGSQVSGNISWLGADFN